MNYQNDHENEIQRREQQLHERERAIRLRELENEINQPPVYETQKHPAPASSRKQLYRKLVNVGKFVALVVVVAVSFKIAAALASIILVGSVAWVAYKLFFDGNRSKN